MKKKIGRIPVSHRRPVDPVSAQLNAVMRAQVQKLDAEHRARMANLNPTPKFDWEVAREHTRKLENRIAELESMLNDAVDELADAKETIRKMKARRR